MTEKIVSEPQHDGSDAIATTLITTGLGLIGGAMSVLFGPAQMSAWQKVGCIVAGGTCAFVGAPLVTLVWPSANERIVALAGFLFGIAGLFLVRGLLVWLARLERRIPEELDKRAGIDTRTPIPKTPDAKT